MASKKKAPSGASEIPIIFTISSSNRHELFITSTASSLSDICSEIESLASNSPNCKEFMSKYKKAADEKVVEVKVKWGAAGGRDSKIWPASTVLTEENTEAVLMMIERGGGLGRDVLEVKMEAKKEEGLPERTK